MNHKLLIPSSHFLVLLYFSFQLFDQIPLCSSFDWYTTCSNKYRCGMIEADFPFWGDGRPEGCGYPGLKLNCDKNIATIDIRGVKYRVLEMETEAGIFKIARTDYLNGICSPQYGNTSLDPELFEYAPASGDITLLYRCPSEMNLYMGGFNCSTTGKGFIVPGRNGSAGTGLVCGLRVIARVPDPVRNYGEVGNASVIAKALGEGFRVKYKVDFEACEECRNSNGVCGYDWRQNETTCYCQNDPFLGLKTCPNSTPEFGGEVETPDDNPENEQYRNCSTRFNCRNIQDVGYPFWMASRPEYCGHPKFKLNCSGEAPMIAINSIDYRVLRIYQEEHVLTVARADYWNETCPDDHKNATLDDPTLFEYSTDTQDLSLYYSCTGASGFTDMVPSKFSCPGDTTTSTNYFATDRMKDSISMYTYACEESVVVRISNSEAGVLEGGNTLSRANLSAALDSGFGIDWNANNIRCDDCARSAGVCGFNSTTNQFTCYCGDGPYAARCGSDSVGSRWSSNATRNIGIGIGAAALGIFVSSIFIICYYKRECIPSTRIAFWKRTTREQEFDVRAFIRNYESFAPKRYSYAAVKKMTNSFAEKIGKGGFGAVYKGKLSDGLPVAVKVLHESRTSNGEEFINEVASIGRTSHVNIVTLLGFCYEKKKRALVYEYMPNGSLDKLIFNQESSNAECRLEWKILYEIAIGIARGLEYLHRGCNTRILHLDIKPQNILLDKDFCPKISDFGLAKLCLTKESIVSMVGARGTIGYIAPEVFSWSYGGVSHKSDVYSYGMLILEMVGGRKNFDSAASHTSEIYFPNRIFKDLEMGNEFGILGNITEEEKELSKKMMLVSFWCIQMNPADRPSMSKAVDMLEGSLESIEFPPKPYLFSPTRSPQQSTTLPL